MMAYDLFTNNSEKMGMTFGSYVLLWNLNHTKLEGHIFFKRGQSSS